MRDSLARRPLQEIRGEFAHIIYYVHSYFYSFPVRAFGDPYNTNSTSGGSAAGWTTEFGPENEDKADEGSGLSEGNAFLPLGVSGGGSAIGGYSPFGYGMSEISSGIRPIDIQGLLAGDRSSAGVGLSHDLKESVEEEKE